VYKINYSLTIEEKMLVTPVNVATAPVSKSRPVSWENVARRVANATVNDNPATAVTRQVPSQQFKGQFIDLLS